MPKSQNQRRQQKAARRRRREEGTRRNAAVPGDRMLDFGGPIFQPGGIFGGGFQSLDELADDFDVSPPPEALMDTTHCPSGTECEGCGTNTGLHPVVAVFGGDNAQWDAACATLCEDCDGQSFLRLLGFEATQEAVSRHQSHAA